MKKFFALFFALALLVTALPCGASYLFDGNPLYSIELPDDYDLVDEDKYISDNGDTLVVSCEPNSDKFCVADLSETEIKEYAQKLADEGTQAFKSLDMDGKMEIVSHKIIENINGKAALVITLKTSAKKETGETVRLQKIYEFTGEENKYIFAYTAKKDENIDALDEYFNTIVIKEKQIESKKDKLVTLGMCAGVVVLIFVGVIKFIIKTPYTKNKTKIK